MARELTPWGQGPQRDGPKIRAFETGITVPHMKDIPSGCLSSWVPKNPAKIMTDKTYVLKNLSWTCRCEFCTQGQKLMREKLGMR